MDEIGRIDRQLAGLHHQYTTGNLSRFAYLGMADDLLEQRIEHAGRSLLENAGLAEFGEAGTGTDPEPKPAPKPAPPQQHKGRGRGKGHPW